ncbi:HNH endonuclease signature motif containing protein [Rhizohabitans arisaemae]|uniref:HNH endonuclease signature motif containing protein n=1 Tax=Rhizohabitans arisaemae TaxID=2720610 RepID=UPI0024B1B346|nr:HNH endonuclease signature motif containing protein [Rhizohabitans arisaemae]
MSVPVTQRIPAGLAQMPPGPGLAVVLAGIDETAVSAADAVVVLKAWSRQRAHDEARFMAVMVEVGLRAPGPGSRVCRQEVPDEFSADELRPALAWSRSRASSRFAEAWDLLSRLPKVHEALEHGVIDEVKARVFATWTRELTAEQARSVCGRLLAVAGFLTAGELVDTVKRAALAIDPDWAERRCAAAVRERRVVGSRNPDGTANLSGVDQPLDRVAASCSRMDSLARRAKAAGDRRLTQHIRSELFLGLLDGGFQGWSDERIVAFLVAESQAEQAEAEGGSPPEITPRRGVGSPAHRGGLRRGAGADGCDRPRTVPGGMSGGFARPDDPDARRAAHGSDGRAASGPVGRSDDDTVAAGADHRGLVARQVGSPDRGEVPARCNGLGPPVVARRPEGSDAVVASAPADGFDDGTTASSGDRRPVIVRQDPSTGRGDVPGRRDGVGAPTGPQRTDGPDARVASVPVDEFDNRTAASSGDRRPVIVRQDPSTDRNDVPGRCDGAQAPTGPKRTDGPDTEASSGPAGGFGDGRTAAQADGRPTVAGRVRPADRADGPGGHDDPGSPAGPRRPEVGWTEVGWTEVSRETRGPASAGPAAAILRVCSPLGGGPRDRTNTGASAHPEGTGSPGPPGGSPTTPAQTGAGPGIGASCEVRYTPGRHGEEPRSGRNGSPEALRPRAAPPPRASEEHACGPPPGGDPGPRPGHRQRPVGGSAVAATGPEAIGSGPASGGGGIGAGSPQRWAAGELRVDVTTLLGLDERPGELAGWGPVTAGQARRIACDQAGGLWRCVLTDDEGRLIDCGVTRHRPAPSGQPHRVPVGRLGADAGDRSGSAVPQGKLVPQGKMVNASVKAKGVVEIRIAEAGLARLLGIPDLPEGWRRILGDIARLTAGRDRVRPGGPAPGAGDLRHRPARTGTGRTGPGADDPEGGGETDEGGPVGPRADPHRAEPGFAGRGPVRAVAGLDDPEGEDTADNAVPVPRTGRGPAGLHGAEPGFAGPGPSGPGAGSGRRFADASLRRYVQVRDRVCTAPGCAVPAARTDQDHIREWSRGGPTTAGNLHSVCRHDHRLRHEGGWQATMAPTGDIVWTTRLGQICPTSPPPTVIPLPDAAPRTMTLPDCPIPDDDTPIFLSDDFPSDKTWPGSTAFRRWFTPLEVARLNEPEIPPF